MPLLQVSINTDVQENDNHTLLGSEGDGTFRILHRMTTLPPPETEYTIKHVYLNSTINDSRKQTNSIPMMWVGIDFPQLDDEMVARRDQIITVQDVNPDFGEIQRPHQNTRGVLRFPVTSYPVDGVWSGDGTTDSNVIRRFADISKTDIRYEQKGTHVTNIPLGRIRMEEDFLEVIITPYDDSARIFTQTEGNDRICKVQRIQIILEYK